MHRALDRPARTLRPRAATWVSLPLLALLLAGCTVEPPQLQDGSEEAPAREAPRPGEEASRNASFHAPPRWQVGQWWRYSASDSAGARPDTRVVVADAGSAWQVGTDSATTAYFDARFDISNIGPIRKADLSGAQRGVPVRFYEWPLTVNATWTTSWDGLTREVRVVGPGVAQVRGQVLDAMQLEAYDPDGRLSVRYDYVPETGWASTMQFLAADGSVFRLDLQDYGAAFDGAVTEVAVEELHRDASGSRLRPESSFAVRAGTTFLDLQARFEGGAVAYELTLVPPGGEPVRFSERPCTSDCRLQVAGQVPAQPGTWRLLAAGAVHGGEGPPPVAEVTVLAAEVRERPVS